MKPPSQLARVAMNPTRNAPAAGGGLNASVARVNGVGLALITAVRPAVSPTGTACTAGENEMTKKTAAPIVAADAARNPHWVTIFGSARRSARRLTGR